MAFMCKSRDCYETATWKCDGCDKIYCAMHQQIPNHKCRKCNYCRSRAHDFCRECNEFVCSEFECKLHMLVCDSSDRSDSSNFSEKIYNRSEILSISD